MKTELKQLIIGVLTALLMILDANGVIKVPKEALALISGSLIAGLGVVTGLKALAMGKIGAGGDIVPQSVSDGVHDRIANL